MVSNARNKRGSFVRLDPNKRSMILSAAESTRFSTLTQLAIHLGVSKTTLTKYLREFNSKGLLSDNNYLLHRTINPGIKVSRPILARGLFVRKQRIIDFIGVCRKKSGLWAHSGWKVN